MKYKLAPLTTAEINSLSPKLKEEVLFVRDNTENFDELYYEVFQENDERLYKLVDAELESKKTKQESKKTVVEKPKVAAKKTRVPEVVMHEKPYKKVTFKGELDPVYHVVKTIGDEYVVVVDEKLDLYHNAAGTDKVELYQEQIPKDEFQAYKEPKSKTVKQPEPKVDTKKETKPTAEPKKQPEAKTKNTAPKTSEKKNASAIEKPTDKTKNTRKADDVSTASPDYSWRKKVPKGLIEDAKKVSVNCEFYAVPTDESMLVEIKQTFNKGDMMLVHEDGYPFAVMNGTSFKRRCVKVEEIEKEEKVVEEKPVVKKESEKEAKDESLKQEPEAKKPTKGECNLKAMVGNPPVPLLTWVDGQIELWKNRETNRKISKVMVVKETGEVVIEFTHYDKLLRIADLRLSYHKICLESTKLTKVEEPKRGSYRLLVKREELRKDYSTKRNWSACRKWIREAYECARAGNCSEKQRELFKKFYHECGDLTAKGENVAYLRWLHQKAGESWEKGEESYLEAFGRVVEKLKKSSQAA